jgi:hypothetical protein
LRLDLLTLQVVAKQVAKKKSAAQELALHSVFASNSWEKVVVIVRSALMPRVQTKTEFKGIAGSLESVGNDGRAIAHY